MELSKATKLFSPLEVIVLTIESKDIVKKSDSEKPISSLLADKVESFISVGEYATRNPTYWNVSGGKKKDEVQNWRHALCVEIENSKLNVKVTDLDNNNNVVETSCEVSMLVVNFKELSKELMKEIKCARVHTVFGQIELQV